MAKNLLYDKTFESSKPKDKEYLLADGEGLFLRVRPTSAKDWFFIYTHSSKRNKLALGKYPTLSLVDARKAAEALRKTLASGIDPKQKAIDDELAAQAAIKTRELELAAEANRHSVNSLFIKWEKEALCDRKDNGKEVRRMFEKDVLPLIGAMAVEDVRKGHIVNIIDTMLDRGIKRMVKIVLKLIRQMLRFAQEKDIIENDPTSSIRVAKVGGKDVVRTRHLSEAEIRELTAKIPSARLLKKTECALWLMLSTCCRIGEICKAQWKHLDLEAKTWSIPPENSKNGKPHTIYLSAFAASQFGRLVALKTSDIWIYPNTDNTDHVCIKSITKQVGDRQMPVDRERMSGRSKHGDSLKLDGGKWTPHDLRRTGATTMGNLGIISDVIEKCLNHIEENEMKKTYQHQTLTAEQTQAWKLLGERLEILTSNNTSNVISIPKKVA
jgi:integrase